MRNHSFLNIKLASDPKSISEIEPLIKTVFQTYEISDDRFPDILISLTEAVNNAICHGNKLCDEKYVLIDIIKEHNSIRCCVSDQGQGFNPESIEDPTQRENIELCGGRGVMIIKHLSDQVIFLNNGSRIEIIFNI